MGINKSESKNTNRKRSGTRQLKRRAHIFSLQTDKTGVVRVADSGQDAGALVCTAHSAAHRLRAERRHAGFTLVEMLAALIVVTLLTTVVATGVNVGMKVYRQSTFTSEAQTLSNTIENALADPMHFANTQSLSTTTDGVSSTALYWHATYLNHNVSPQVQLQSDNRADGTQIQVLAFAGQADGKKNEDVGKTFNLLNVGAYTDCTIEETPGEDLCKISPAAPTSAGERPTSITVNFTIRSTVDPTLSKDCSFTYKPINAKRS